MEDVVCPHCSVMVPLKEMDVGPDDEFVECPGCGMLIDLKEMAKEREEKEVESQWVSVQAKRKREVSLALVILLLGSIIAGITAYVFWILNRFK